MHMGLCVLHAGGRLAPAYCHECHKMHLVCQTCGAPVEVNAYAREYSDPHTGARHFCDCSEFWLGDIHECICGAVIVRYPDGCALDYYTHTEHVCAAVRKESLPVADKPKAQPPAKPQPAQGRDAAPIKQNRPKTVSI